jgi:hypothetical protein
VHTLIIAVFCNAVGMVKTIIKAKHEMDELALTSGEMGSSIDDESPESHQKQIDAIYCVSEYQISLLKEFIVGQ